jgi:FkbM family methyltransferase
VIVTSWHDYPGAILGRTESALLEWFELNVRPGESWLDVGAHYGYTAIALSQLVGPRGRVFAFEPVLSTAGHLGRTRALNRFAQLTVLPFGLGAPDLLELKRLPVVRGMADSTLEGEGWLDTLLVVRLDSIWRNICNGQRRVDGVKIDVQGMEIETLKGMTTVLREFKPKLVLEVHVGVDRRELIDLIESLGYSGTGEPVEVRVEKDSPIDSRQYIDDRSYVFCARTGAASETG